MFRNDGHRRVELRDVSKKQIKKALDHQRRINFITASKLIGDQKTLVRVAKHYEKKRAKLEAETLALKPGHSKKLQDLVERREKAMQINRQAFVDAQILKQAVWKEVAVNRELVHVVNALTKNVECYQQLIATKKEEYNAMLQHDALQHLQHDADCDPFDDHKEQEDRPLHHRGVEVAEQQQNDQNDVND